MKSFKEHLNEDTSKKATSSAQVNKALKKLGYDVNLYRGNGYWYFNGPDADDLEQQGVYTPRIGDLTVDQWVDEFVSKKRRR